MKEVRRKTFNYANEVCEFINQWEYEVVSICAKPDGGFILFYYFE